MNLEKLHRGNMNYFASPKNSDRARRFREAYANATPGQNFMFEGQPYAGPEGLLPNQEIQPPSGGWTGGVDPNNFINNSGPVTSIASGMVGPSWQQDPDKFKDFMIKAEDRNARENFREWPINPLTGQPEYLTGDIWGEGPPTDGRDQVIDMYGKVTYPNYTGTSLPFDDPSIAGERIPFPEQTPEQMAGSMYRVGDPSYPRFAAANQMGTAEGYNHQMVNAPMGFGMSGPGQDTGQPLPGLLASESPVSKGPGWFERHYPESFQKRKTAALLDDTHDKSGWEKDKKFSNTQKLLVQLGMNQMQDNSNPFDDGW